MTDDSSRSVALDPQWLPHTFDAEGLNLTSVFVPRAQREELMFLSDEFYAGKFHKVTHAANEISAHLQDVKSSQLHFIFHTAFCCSTLLIKALDIPGLSLGLKEPDILINVANRIAQRDDPSNRSRLALTLRLLGRPFEPRECVVVKPTNFANRLIVPALETRPEAHAVLLYSDLTTLLRSVAKRGLWGRIWARKLYRSVAAWTSLQLGYGPGETFELSDLQVAGLAWLMQIRHFQEVASLMPGRVSILDSADFMADPKRTIADVSRSFGLSLDEAAIDATVNGPVFGRHSKFSQRDYSIDAREAENDVVVRAHGEEIGVVAKWIEAVAEHAGVELNGASLADPPVAPASSA